MKRLFFSDSDVKQKPPQNWQDFCHSCDKLFLRDEPGGANEGDKVNRAKHLGPDCLLVGVKNSPSLIQGVLLTSVGQLP